MLRRFFRRYLANAKLIFVRTYFKFSKQATHLILPAFLPRATSGGAGPSTTSSLMSSLRFASGRIAPRGAGGSPSLSYVVSPSLLEGGGETNCDARKAPADVLGSSHDAGGDSNAGVTTAVVGTLEGPSAPEVPSPAPSRLEGDPAAVREKEPARGATNEHERGYSAKPGSSTASPRRVLGQIAPGGAGGTTLLSASPSHLDGGDEEGGGRAISAGASGHTPCLSDGENREG